jgi:hypothetical protein
MRAMSRYRGRYRNGREYDSDISYQEYSNNDIESSYTTDEYFDEQDYGYQDYEYQDSQEYGYQDYEYQDSQASQEYGYQDYEYQEPQASQEYGYQDYEYQESQASQEYGYQDYDFQEPQESQEQQESGHQDETKYSFQKSVFQNDQQNHLRERQSRQRRRIREEKRRRRIRRLKIIRAILVGGMLLILAAVIFTVRLIFFQGPIRRKVTVEAGTELDIKDFLRKKNAKAEFVTDISKISLDHVGEQKIVLKVKKKEKKSRLIIQDTVAPKAEAVDGMINVGGELEPRELVTNIKDATDVKCSFKKKPDFSKEGTVSVSVVLTDEGGNTAEVEAKVQVIVDKEAPVIDGVAPLIGFIGEPISYKSAITVTDNCTKNIEVTVDNSQVDTKTEGTYDVFYLAVDGAGNEAEASTTITIKSKPENYVTPEEALEEADEILKEITTKDMTLKEKARAIYNWTRTEIGYVNTSEKDSWTNGAHQGFTERSGDCFVFFSTAKALLTQAKIPNLDVVKSDVSESSHFWSLIDCGDGWYHFDTTPRYGGGDDFFMKTDAEILKYSKNHGNSHIFDQSLYPPTPTEASTVE